MPSPNKGESKDKFISRCMGDSEARKTFPEQDQRAAFCYSQWRRRNKKKDSSSSSSLCPNCEKKANED